MPDPARAGYARARVALTAVMISLGAVAAAAVRLHSETIAAWSSYVSGIEARIGREVHSSSGFLGLDFGADASDRRDVLAGRIVVRMIENTEASGGRATAPGGLIHHVRGAVLLRRQTVRRLLGELQAQVPPQEDIVRATVLEQQDDWMRVYLRLRRARFVTVTFDTEHTVIFTRFGDTRAMSASTATRIAEVSEPDTPGEHDLPPGDDRGFLWRLNSYWRYEEVAGGVIAECESLSLSRDVPSLLRYALYPIVESTARDSMERTLAAFRTRFTIR